ncbi:MAG: hypothetical protein WB239_10925 [Acidimicrobiia bacterium]
MNNESHTKRELEPEEPEDVGIHTELPDLAQIEPAYLLANDARPELEARGFTEEEILHWAETYITEEGGTADVDDFLAWIAEEEQ